MSESTPPPSYTQVYPTPPPVKYPYDPAEALGDLPGVCYALEMFLASHMIESEKYCHDSDVKRERLYFTTGYGLIQCVKGLMSYADEDLLSAINYSKHGNTIASQHRKRAGFFGALTSSTTAFIATMSPVERHAELLYAESLFLKALLGIVYSGDWLAFIKEALNMRTTIGVYRHLGAYLEEADAKYAAGLDSASSSSSTYASSFSTSTSSSTTTTTTTTNSSSSTSSSSTSTSSTSSATTATTTNVTASTSTTSRIEDPSIDPHFRSGVYLGVGVCNIILSLLPGKLATLIELFGYKGDRKQGLEQLMRAGGWTNNDEPTIGTREEGVRRTICDMALLIFHLVLSTITVEGVDISVAQRIVAWNLKRYPNGVFFLFGAGRLALQRSQPRLAIKHYTKAMHSQVQYRNLAHISFWEIAIARLALWEVGDVVVAGEGKGTVDSQGAGAGEHGAGGVNGEGEAHPNGARGGGDKENEWEKVEKVKEAEMEEELGGSAACWRVLQKEATWSKSIYSYGLAACLLEPWDTDVDTPEGTKAVKDRIEEARALMRKVPELRQKIAGKSIPLEKLFARKARKFVQQKNRLLLPTLEVAYIFQAIAHSPRGIIARKMLPQVRGALENLALYGEGTGIGIGDDNVHTNNANDGDDEEASGPKSAKSVKSFVSALSRVTISEKTRKVGGKEGVEKYEGGAHEYWDDLCLARFLEGVCMRFIAYPDPDAVLEDDETVDISRDEAESRAEEAFRAVFEYGPKIELDHHLVYHAHYEFGRLLACQGDTAGAKREFELVLSGKYLEVGPSGRKGKYSMENALHIRTHAALDVLLKSH